jgi:metal-responsive CopG/Arc/MetJ family transcriptional regulator
MLRNIFRIFIKGKKWLEKNSSTQERLGKIKYAMRKKSNGVKQQIFKNQI